MTGNNLFKPLSTLQWVDRNKLKANDYNPNKVSKDNLELLKQSILSNGWTLPIVVRPDYTIIDGFHRWTVAGQEPLKSMLGGKVPVVIVEHKTRDGDIYGTITHNRARGVHLLEPMKNIVFTYNAFGGWLNYFRLSNICRHSADFTPPAGKPVADEYTLSLLNFER